MPCGPHSKKNTLWSPSVPKRSISFFFSTFKLYTTSILYIYNMEKDLTELERSNTDLTSIEPNRALYTPLDF